LGQELSQAFLLFYGSLVDFGTNGTKRLSQYKKSVKNPKSLLGFGTQPVPDCDSQEVGVILGFWRA
jgi:hypothetical protein